MDSSSRIWTVLAMLEWATDYFTQKKVNQPRLSIEWILAHVLEMKRLDVYLCFDRPLTGEELSRLRECVKRRALHEPLQYITGETAFMNACIRVNPSVLIPRQETEQLVGLILQRYSKGPGTRVLDVGTGSGCIAVALKMERPNWIVHGLDLSAEALSVARENARLNSAEVDFTEGSLFELSSLFAENSYDLIVSNPPYIGYNEKEALAPEVREYEPGMALFCEEPVQVYAAILNSAEKLLSKSGTLFFELNDLYSHRIAEEAKSKNWQVSLLYDLDSNPRFLECRKPDND